MHALGGGIWEHADSRSGKGSCPELKRRQVVLLQMLQTVSVAPAITETRILNEIPESIPLSMARCSFLKLAKQNQAGVGPTRRS